MLEELITLYCIRYDPYLCSQDPELIWTVVERSGGHVHTGAVGILDFYVPEAIVTQVLLMDSALKIKHKKSYI